MKLRAVIEVEDTDCDDCEAFPDCAECFEYLVEGKRSSGFDRAKLIKVEKVKNGK